MKYLISILMVLMFFICLFSLSTRAQAFKRISKGDKIIPFTFKSLAEQTVSVDSYQGKSALAMIFWKYPSDRCVEEMDVLQELCHQYKNKGFEVIAIYSPATDVVGDDEMSKIYELVADKNWTFQIFIDADLSIYNKYGVLTFPSLALVSKDGVVSEIMAGFPKFSGKKNLVNNVMSLLGIELRKEEGVEGYQPDKKAERHFMAAKKMYNSGFYGKAENNLQQALAIDTGYADAYTLLGNVCVMKGNVELAEKNFKISSELGTINNGDVHYGLGMIYRIQKKYDEAVSEFEEAIRIFECGKSDELNLAHSYYELGLIAYDLKQEDKSINRFRQANKLYRKIIADVKQK